MERVSRLSDALDALTDNEFEVFDRMYTEKRKRRRGGSRMDVLEQAFEECRKEYADAPKLSDEEIDRILKEIRQNSREGGNPS